MPPSPPSRELRYGAITAAESAALDAAAADRGTPLATLMERAGRSVAVVAAQYATAQRVIVLAGSGNNGGDGVVAAGHLTEQGCAVELYVVADPSTWRHADIGRRAQGAGVAVTVDPSPTQALRALSVAEDVCVIDGLLGAGARGAPRPAHAELIVAMRGHRVVSVDIPSGLDGDSGSASKPTCVAVATCVLAAVKRGMWLASAAPYCGAMHVADIGMPPAAWQHIGIAAPTEVSGGRIVAVAPD